MKFSLIFLIVAFVAMSAVFFNEAAACGAHDSPCLTDTNDAQGDCCEGTICHKNDPTWAQGRCYYPTQLADLDEQLAELKEE